MPVPRDAGDEKLLEIVERFGWHVTLVGDDGENPGFAYSTGILATTGHPEAIVIGLPAALGHFVINEYGSLCHNGAGPELRVRYDGYLEGHPVVFLRVTDPVCERYATWSKWFYDGQDVPYIQIVFPDSQTGAFPWEPGYRPEMRHEQPLLGEMPAE